MGEKLRQFSYLAPLDSCELLYALTICLLGNVCMLSLSSGDCFQNQLEKKSFMSTISVKQF